MDEFWNEAARFGTRLLSTGYGLSLALATSTAQGRLMAGAARLTQFNEEPPEEDVTIQIGAFVGVDGLLEHDDVLLPAWEQFAEALTSLDNCGQGHFILSLRQVQLESTVTNMLLRSFETANIHELRLEKNNLGRKGLEFLAKAVTMIDTLKSLLVDGNRIEVEENATSLFRATITHRRVDSLRLSECSIGQNHGVMAAIVPALNHLESVALQGNYIGSHGARLISDCLAGNPVLTFLCLSDNLLNDGDAIMFADSLKTNTQLRKLCLAKNNFTHVGINTMHLLVCNASNLNSINDSNHTCFLDLGLDEQVAGVFNQCRDPELNRVLKLLSAMRNVNLMHISYKIQNAPLKITPRILAFLQAEDFAFGEGFVVRNQGATDSKYNALNEVFLFVREWNMPLLYTSGTGPELRRSERIRKKKITYYMRM